VRLREEECARQRSEKQGLQQEQRERQAEAERDRRDSLVKIKLLEARLFEAHEKLQEADR
jgi:hypothetical protein